jgi:CubicO group peptidase (beta-lactamase class C family)
MESRRENMAGQDRIDRLLEAGVREGVYPGAVLLAAKGDQVCLFSRVGHRRLSPKPAPMQKETIFDLASLTKPLATTLAVMKLVEEGSISLDQPVTDILGEVVPRDKRTVTPRLLLCHAAGFPSWIPFYRELARVDLNGRKQILRQRLLHLPLTYSPGKGTEYSDLGFMLLEWLVEKISGTPLPAFLDRRFYGPLSLQRTFLSESPCQDKYPQDEFAATEDCPWRGKMIQGFVDDENAYALGGYSGHAGLFGCAAEVYALLNLLRMRFLGRGEDYLLPETVRGFLRRQDLVKGSTWALGWDTPSPRGSSSGRYFSSQSVGHLGFTGTSVWMDLVKDVIVIFLTNRVHPTRSNEQIKEFRPRIHDAVMEELDLVSGKRSEKANCTNNQR